ncbi:zinc finger protein 704-like [Ylistrum balloti]|uniref:zinc finger protein 704-like n=1 Tax=Ylistrum balloti TaxID=509963 RepID=UPI002905B97C|nr:zinc finger protein 704-like [Ylistrum balloti]
MFGNRRLAKRSIIGTKICAAWQDGRYYPGTIQNHPAEGDLHREPKYTVRFDDGFQREVNVSDIVGPGFSNISSITLKHGQKVYLTLNGREVQGSVAEHNRTQDEVIIIVPTQSGDGIELIRKIDDLRLMESRKSARLVDQATDYSKLADLNVQGDKKRTVSHVIDVPSKSQRYRRPSIDDEEKDNVQTEENDVEMMDETIAAMVLTSLSCSPQSPKFQMSQLTDLTNKSPAPLSSSVASSGFHSERSDPSPPLSSNLSESAPAASGSWFFGSYPKDDGVVLEENDDEYDDVENMEPKRKRVESHGYEGHKKTVFKCTWKKCNKIHDTVSSIEAHVRTAHLGLSESDSNLLDHEEEFYYTEIEVTMDHVTEKFSDMCTSSPPELTGFEFGRPIPDHDYQKKEHRQNVGNMFASSVPSGGFQPVTPSGSLPITMPQIKRSLSWQNNNTSSSGLSMSPSVRSSKPSPQERLQQHQAQSPKSHLFSSHKKPRSEVRKCRKVYGMENRDMWCTQCKWKKACSRFAD